MGRANQTDLLRAALAGGLEPGEEESVAENVAYDPSLKKKMDDLIRKERIDTSRSTFHAKVKQLTGGSTN